MHWHFSFFPFSLVNPIVRKKPSDKRGRPMTLSSIPIRIKWILVLSLSWWVNWFFYLQLTYLCTFVLIPEGSTMDLNFTSGFSQHSGGLIVNNYVIRNSHRYQFKKNNNKNVVKAKKILLNTIIYVLTVGRGAWWKENYPLMGNSF